MIGRIASCSVPQFLRPPTYSPSSPPTPLFPGILSPLSIPLCILSPPLRFPTPAHPHPPSIFTAPIPRFHASTLPCPHQLSPCTTPSACPPCTTKDDVAPSHLPLMSARRTGGFQYTLQTHAYDLLCVCSIDRFDCATPLLDSFDCTRPLAITYIAC